MDALVGVRATVMALFCASSPVAPSWLLQQAQEQRHQEHILEWVCWGHMELGCHIDIYCNSTYPSTHVNTSGISLAGNPSFCAMIEHNKNQQEARQTEKFFPLFFLSFTTYAPNVILMSSIYLSRYQFLNTVYNHIQYKSQTLQITGFKNTVLFFLPYVKQENQKQCDPYFNSYSALVTCSNIIKRSRMIYSLIYSCLHYETVKKKGAHENPVR